MRFARSLLPLVALLGAAFAGAPGAAGAASKYPPCTRKALSAGLARGTAQPRNAKFTGSFACAAGWAYSGVVVGHGPYGYDAVAVYRDEHGVWVTVDRAKPCRTRAIPKSIYRGACTTS